MTLVLVDGHVGCLESDVDFVEEVSGDAQLSTVLDAVFAELL